MKVKRRPGFYEVLRARLEAIASGADPGEALDITEEWLRGRISWREAVKRLEELAERYRGGAKRR